MNKLEHTDFQLINKHSSIEKAQLQAGLENHIYAKKKDWMAFLQLLLLSLGIGFTAIGMVFFFAYNWQDLPKFFKLGLIESAIIAGIAVQFIPKIQLLTKNIILMATCLLTGVLFAVFGQIYQTGADAYDFFLGWLLAVSIWAILSNFPVLWLSYIVLFNVTAFLFIDQTSLIDEPYFIYLIFFGINALFLLIYNLVLTKISTSSLLENSLYAALIGLSCYFISIGFFETHFPYYASVLIVGIATHILSAYIGWKIKNLFLIAISMYSAIIIITFLINSGNIDEGSLILSILFCLISVTASVYGLLKLNKQWKYGKVK